MRFTLSPGRLGRDIDLPAGLLEHTLHHASPTSVYSAFDAEDAPARIPFCSQQGPPRNAALLPNQRGMPPLPPAFKKLDRQLEAVGIDLRGSLLCDRATWISSIISDLDYDLDDSCVHVHLIDGDCHSCVPSRLRM